MPLLYFGVGFSNQLFLKFNSPWAIILHRSDEAGPARGADGYLSAQKRTICKMLYAAGYRPNEGG